MSEHTQAPTVAQIQVSLEHEAGVLSAELYNLDERRRELHRRLREIAAQQAVTKAAERELKQMTGQVEELENLRRQLQDAKERLELLEPKGTADA